MAATLSSVNIALDRVWTQKTLEDQLYSETPFLDRLKKTSRYTVGETARVPLHVGRNGGYTALPDAGGTLNTAGQQGLAKAEFNYTNHNRQIAVQGSAIDGTQGTNAIVDVVDLEVKGALTDLNRDLTRQLFMNGDALITACRTSASNNVDLNLVDGAHAISRGWFYVDQPISVGSAASELSVTTTSRLITAIDEANTALTVSGAAVTTEAATDYVSHTLSRSGATSYEMNGLQNIVSATSTLGGLTVAAQPTWKSTVNSTSQSLSLSLLLQGRQQIRQKSGSHPNFILTGLKQERKFYELLQSQVHWKTDSAIDVGSTEHATWQGQEIWADPDCQDAYLYLGHFERFFMVALDKPYWQNKVTGGDILSWIQGQDAYGAKITYRSNLAVNRRNDMYVFNNFT